LLGEAADNGGTELYESGNPDELSRNLREVFSSIRSGAAAGSAASVISASRGGEGAVYQAIFWPTQDRGDGTGAKVYWTGEVHSLFVDSTGYLYEDTNRNRTLDPDADSNPDKKVQLYYDTGASTTKACVDGTVTAGVCEEGTETDLKNVKYLWSANDWLAKISHSTDYTPFDADDVTSNRGTYIDDQRARYIFTWSDGDGDGIVDDGEVLDFIDRSGGTDWDDASLYTAAERGSVHKDFGDITAAEVNKIVNWVRGKDQDGMRSRAAKTNLDKDDDTADEDIIWRLGDVIHSTPMAVGRPAEAYHFLYRDDSYAVFANTYWNRRQVVYFGGNDGMMHAVNGGFYNTDDKKFYRTSNWDETDLSAAPELGAELWAYVPYNLLPHLSCLTDSDYDSTNNHKYYVDLRPRIFDVRIWPHDPDDADYDSVHPYGWGTILVGGMRLGGATVNASDLNSLDGGAGEITDSRQFKSAYFILDIT
ncbi:MAG: hypothetical protein KAJ60_11010, partial [Desulfobulbaceae bacterium]|nr:hypothetical protein [Desulfobulbaceae bacterium]